MGYMKQVIFKLGVERYGFDIMLVNAIETIEDVVAVPNAPRFILGIINLRGDVIPVYSLRAKFGLPELPQTEESKLIITKSRGMQVGFIVDSVDEIVEISDAQISEVPTIVQSASTKYAKNIATINGKMVILLDHDGILNEEEQRSIGKLVTE